MLPRKVTESLSESDSGLKLCMLFCLQPKARMSNRRSYFPVQKFCSSNSQSQRGTAPQQAYCSTERPNPCKKHELDGDGAGVMGSLSAGPILSGEDRAGRTRGPAS